MDRYPSPHHDDAEPDLPSGAGWRRRTVPDRTGGRFVARLRRTGARTALVLERWDDGGAPVWPRPAVVAPYAPDDDRDAGRESAASFHLLALAPTDDGGVIVFLAGERTWTETGAARPRLSPTDGAYVGYLHFDSEGFERERVCAPLAASDLPGTAVGASYLPDGRAMLIRKRDAEGADAAQAHLTVFGGEPPRLLGAGWRDAPAEGRGAATEVERGAAEAHRAAREAAARAAEDEA